jgi:hypothetical protein
METLGGESGVAASTYCASGESPWLQWISPEGRYFLRIIVHQLIRLSLVLTPPYSRNTVMACEKKLGSDLESCISQESRVDLAS